MTAAPVRRRLWRTVRAILREPLEAWPPQIYRDPVLRTRLLGRDTLFVCDPALIGAVLNEDAAAFEKADSMRRALRPALGDAILTAEGAHWRRQRQVAAPLFRPAETARFVPAMLAAARATRDRWLALPPGTAIELGREMAATTFAIIAATMLSDAGAVDAARVERAMTRTLASTGWPIALSLLRLPVWTPYPGRLRAARASAALRRDMLRLVQRRRGDRRPDLVTALIDAAGPDGLTPRDVADNLLTFIAAGHETTAAALCWTFHLLAAHPDVEARVLAEIVAVTGSGPVGAEHLPQLDLTRRVIQESMRLYPPAALLVRRALRPVQLGSHRVERGTNVYVPIYAVHRHQALWPDPERFDPDRFLPDAVTARPRYAYLPFGAGPRICIGAGLAMTEAVAVLATLLPAVRLVGMGMPRPSLRITLRPKGGMVRVEARGAAPGPRQGQSPLEPAT